MFQQLKEKLDLVDVAEEILQVSFKQIGDATFAPEDEMCPHCGHKDCYRIKKDGADSFFKCFSCDASGDVITMVSVLKDISLVEAAKLLSKQYNIPLPRDYSPVQDIMNVAAQYYHTTFLEAGPHAELGGLTPVEYQKDQRGHAETSFEEFQIGWSDGGLVEYLNAMGYDPTLITESGLINKKGGDFLPSKAFIYPHKVRGRVSHFTFKDPLKQKEYQLPNKHKLNGHSFFNSDSITKEGPVIIVEGENDCISVAEAGWQAGNICCNGSISTSQLEWVTLHLKDRDIVTIFDSDAAGDKYREKMGKLSRNFHSLIQIKLANGMKDIDEYLKEGGNLLALLEENRTQISESKASDGDDVEVEAEGSGILEKNGAYYKVKFKDGNEFHIKLTNFTIKLLNIFIRGQEREREIVICREDGKDSEPIMIQSEAKVSLKPFKTLVANAIDASFYGKEEDLIAIWEHVYKTSKEVVVHLPNCVGRVKDFKGWLFGDCFISDGGAVHLPDENGVTWISNRSIGLRPMSMETGGSSGDDQTGIPRLLTDLTEEQRVELIGGVLENLATNLGDIGMAINMMAWSWASVHSDEIFDVVRMFPSIYSWGRQGGGKTTINKWLLAFFDIDGPGWNPANQLNSGVSFSRKLSYYASLPMCVDELKLERTTIDMYGVFRSWYNRGGRTVSSKENFGVRTQEVRSTIMYGGEDQFSVDANRARCIHLRIPKNGREEVKSFAWIDSRRRDLPAIGFHWITNKHKIDAKEMIAGMKELDTQLRAKGISSRTSLNWAVVAYFGKKLAEQYCPKFDYMEYLWTAAQDDVDRQNEDETLSEYWNLVEGLLSEERPKLNSEHFRVETNMLHIWWAEVFRVAEREGRNKDIFSKRAIMESMRDEPYFVREGREKFGIKEVQHRSITLDLDKAPDVIKQIAATLDQG